MSIINVENYIANQFQPAPNTIDVTNPATDSVIATIPASATDSVDQAVEAARLAQREWRRVSAVERAVYLHQIADKIRQKSNDLAQIISSEQGKIVALAEAEVLGAAGYFDYVAEWARRLDGEIINSDRPDEHIFINYKPIGVVGGILPWNFPFYLIARKVAAPLLTGNTVVLKPSVETPVNAWLFSQLIDELDLPMGLINIVHGAGSVVGNAMAGHPDIGMITFTGSVSTGSSIMQQAAKNITKVSLELGGNAPVIVLNDANIELAVDKVVESRIINTGQVCNCAERIYVQSAVANEFTDKLTAQMQAVKFGDPIAAHNVGNELDMGPLINGAAATRIDKMVSAAVDAGAQVATGAEIVDLGRGNHYAPTVLLDCNNDMMVMSDEIFGPVLPIQTIADLDEAIALANDSNLGLTSSVFTTNLNSAMRASREIEAGETYINREHMESYQGFHAGVKQSGIGGDDGRHGVYEFMNSHITYIQET